jgi:hypothetical protein
VTADDPTTWQRSSVCLPTDCVEVATHAHEVWIRDSADPGGPVLRITGPAWRRFINRVAAQDGIVACHDAMDGNRGV